MVEAGEETAEDEDSNIDIWQMMKKIQKLEHCRQKQAWDAVAQLMKGIDTEIKKPRKAARKTATENPNSAKIKKWFAQEQTGARGRRLLKRQRQ